MLSFFAGSSGPATDAASGLDEFSARAVHAALGTQLANMEAFNQHVTQMAEELKRLQKQQRAEREAAEREKNDVEARWLTRLRMVRVESALRAGFAARERKMKARCPGDL